LVIAATRTLTRGSPFADADIDAAMAQDEAAGDELDARMARVKSVAAEA
jgi:hypothetical protein